MGVWWFLLCLLPAACAPPPEHPNEVPPPSPAATSTPDAPAPAPPGDQTNGPAPLGNWPDESTTGVPDGVELRPWEGECTITADGTVIEARLVECDLRIRAADVVITNSRIMGSVILRDLEAGHSFSITDSEVHVGPRMGTGLGNGHYTATRVEVTGGGRSAYCAISCTIESSLLHAQAGDPEGAAHLSGIRMGQQTVIRGNSIICEGDRLPPASGCSAALTGYGDFRPVMDNLIEGNLFRSGTASFCAFGGSTRDKPFSNHARDIRFVDNVFERDDDGSCGIHGPIVAFDSDAPGNVWEGNAWSDGEPLPPRN